MENNFNFNTIKSVDGDRSEETSEQTISLPQAAERLHGRVVYTPEGTALSLREAPGFESAGMDEDGVEQKYPQTVEGLISYVRDINPDGDIESVLADLERLVSEYDAMPHEETLAGDMDRHDDTRSVEAHDDIPHTGLRAFLDKHPRAEKYIMATVLALSTLPAGGVKTAQAGGIKLFAPTAYEQRDHRVSHYDMNDFDGAYRDARGRAQEWMRRKDAAADNIVEAVQSLQIAENAYNRNIRYLLGKYDSRLADIYSTYNDRLSLEHDTVRKNAVREEWKRAMLAERSKASEGISRMENDVRSLQSDMLRFMDQSSIHSGSGGLQRLVMNFEYNLQRVDALNKASADDARQHLYQELERYGFKSAQPVAPLRSVGLDASRDGGPSSLLASKSVVRPASVPRPSGPSSEHANDHITNASDQRLFDSLR